MSADLPPSLVRLLRHQDGVVSREQALARGLRPHDVARLCRRREWRAVHPGVYVDHTGPPSWRQRAWAAVLVCGPAVLQGRSAMRAVDGGVARPTRSPWPSIAVAADRRLATG